MFTGLIDHCGTILNIKIMHDAKRVWIQHAFKALTLGESISVDGICLTVIDFDDTYFCCDVSVETRRVTTAESWCIHQKVHLERALLPTTRLGGHFVTGHVDQTAYLKKRILHEDYCEMHFAGLLSSAQAWLVPKGSIAINGVSLTVNAITEDGLSVMLIPHTLSKTTFQSLQEESPVNIEYDMLAKMVSQQCLYYRNVHLKGE